MTVVVGNVAFEVDTKEAHHVIARAVPLSLMITWNICPSTGVPVRFVVMDVIA